MPYNTLANSSFSKKTLFLLNSFHFHDIFKGDIGYGEWSMWGECSSTCGMGKKTRYRTCKKECHGTNVDVAPCEDTPCPSMFNIFTSALSFSTFSSTKKLSLAAAKS